MQPQNPVQQSYDYQNGRGLDGFMSAALDEVSWETNLESVYNTLSQAPIGQSAYSPVSNAIPTNYDTTQITGSQGGTATIGQTQISQDGTISTSTSNGTPAITIGVLG